MNNWTMRAILLALTIMLVATWLRFPFIRAGMPYFYDEDEAHHYNRVVNMVKRGEFNPNYFLKPSLHFYLRMPVVAVGFLASVRAGEIRSVKEIVTRDSFGLADYSFSAFPQKIAKYSRAFSTAFSIFVVLLTVLIAQQIRIPVAGALAAGALVAISPPLISSSATIGVDGMVSVFALLTTALSLRIIDRPTLGTVIAAGVAAGCAIGTKYNAAPIALVPLIAVIVARGAGIGAVVGALITPCLAFLATTPFLLANLPLFLDHIGYEIWHYGVEGHVGHTAEPGINQALFYISCLSRSALGVAALVTAGIGLLLMLALRDKRYFIFLAFPVLYFLLMISQKANFTRNMHIIIPYLACCAGFLLAGVGSKFRKLSGVVVALALIGLSIQPVLAAISQRSALQSRAESRITAANWLKQNLTGDGKTAVSGVLQFEPQVFKLPGVVRVDLKDQTPLSLREQGFSRVIAHISELSSAEHQSELSLAVEIAGDSEAQRIVSNPAIRIYQIR
jgi:hypothetical protein